jgi:hypothetical protein
MKGWTRTVIAICVLLWFAVVSAQKVWSVIRNGGDMEIGDKSTLDESFYSWFGPNALARSTLLERQEQLQYKCDQMSRDKMLEQVQDPEAFRNLLVDEKHKLLYCYVPKVFAYEMLF